jgi:hypothetical protein
MKIRQEQLGISPLLKAPDLGDDQTATATIEKVYEEKLPQTGDTIMIKFKTYDKSLALNKTNTKTLVGLFGDETDDWTGKVVTLYKVLVNNPTTKKETESLRVREYTPKKK